MKHAAPALSRREFLARAAAASGLGALSTEAASTLKPKAASGASLSFATGRIDCQSHLFCPAHVALMEKRDTGPRVFTKEGVRYLQMGDWLRKIPDFYMSVERKLATMDANGIALTALSINDPGPEWFGADGPAVAQLLNDYIADLVRKNPTRFFGLCVLPTQNIAASLRELDRCVQKLGMKGWLVYTNFAGKFPDEKEFRPLFARAVELDIPVLLHPAKPLTIEFVKGYEMTSTLGNMFDNTIAITRLIMSGILDEFPKLKLVCPHLAGTLPYIVGRLDHQVLVLKRGPRNLTRAPSEYLRGIWTDVVSPLPLAIKFAHEFFGPDRLLFSSDHPWVEPDVIADCVRAVGLTEVDEAKIFSGNARQLFRL